MTDCPFHDLPPEQEIHIDWDGHIIPRSVDYFATTGISPMRYGRLWTP